MNSNFYKSLDEMIPNPHCTLNYTRDYELLIATMLSAQCTDDRVNEVTPQLFKYSINEMAALSEDEIKSIIRPCGNMNKKSNYIKKITESLIKNYEGKVPNNREYLESLPGVGRKTTNVVLANIFDEPAFAVDTHVERVSKRLGIANTSDTPLEVENKLMAVFPKSKWNYLHHQLLLFGRTICKAQKPNCENCKIKEYCKYKKD